MELNQFIEVISDNRVANGHDKAFIIKRHFRMNTLNTTQKAQKIVLMLRSMIKLYLFGEVRKLWKEHLRDILFNLCIALIDFDDDSYVT